MMVSIKDQFIVFMQGKEVLSVAQLCNGMNMTKRGIVSNIPYLIRLGLVEKVGEGYRLINQDGSTPEPKKETEPKVESEEITPPIQEEEKLKPKTIKQYIFDNPKENKKQEAKQESKYEDVREDKEEPTKNKSNDNPEIHKKTMAEQIDDIKEKIDILTGMDKKAFQKFKKAKLKGIRKLEKKIRNGLKENRINVVYLKNNGMVDTFSTQIENGSVKINDNWHDAHAMYVWLWKGKQPCLILPEWDIKPIAREDLYQKAVKENSIIDAQVTTIKAIEKLENESEQNKKKPNFMLFIGIAAVGIIVAWLIFGGKK